jgi:hypothetical protein
VGEESSPTDWKGSSVWQISLAAFVYQSTSQSSVRKLAPKNSYFTALSSIRFACPAFWPCKSNKSGSARTTRFCKRWHSCLH